MFVLHDHGGVQEGTLSRRVRGEERPNVSHEGGKWGYIGCGGDITYIVEIGKRKRGQAKVQ